MKQVITLVGLQAGQMRYMNSPEAEAAVAVGTARWPTEAELILGQAIEVRKPQEKQGDADWVYLNVANTDAGPALAGEWPQRAVLTPKMKNSIFVSEPKSGVFHISIGERRATYHLSDTAAGESYVNLFKVLDAEEDVSDEPKGGAPVPVEAEEGADEGEEEAERIPDAAGDTIEVPVGWETMHWKKRIALAEQISGAEPENVGEAMKIIHEYVNRA